MTLYRQAMSRSAATMRALRRISLYLGLGLLAAAVFTELRKPAGQRSWQGHVAGVVPYNFRLTPPPYPSAALSPGGVYPDSDRLLVPRSFGVGWSLNFPALVRRVRALKARRAER